MKKFKLIKEALKIADSENDMLYGIILYADGSGRITQTTEDPYGDDDPLITFCNESDMIRELMVYIATHSR